VQSFLGVEGPVFAGRCINEANNSTGRCGVYQFCQWTPQWLEGIRLCLTNGQTKVVVVVGGSWRLWSSSIRRIFTNSLLFANSLCSPRYEYNTAERTKGLNQRSVPRSRVKWSCCATAMLGAGFPREWPSLILFLVDLDMIRSRIGHQQGK
jgi:hypothetical protein